MLFLLLTVIADVTGVLLLDKAKGLDEPVYLALGLISMIIGFVAFSFATKSMSVSFANAAWSGLSLIIVLIVSRLFLGERINLLQYGCMSLILIGVIGLQFFESS